MTVTTEYLVEQALSGHAVQNIGQVSKEAARALDKLVRAGRLVKCRSSWMNFSPWKTTWCLPECYRETGNGNWVVFDVEGRLSVALAPP